MNEERTRRQPWLVCLLLAAIGLTAWWPVLNCDFILLDDPVYVTANPNIQNGLSWKTVGWALQSGYAANWHPLTWLSHALDIDSLA